jgi:hypothetical protein
MLIERKAEPRCRCGFPHYATLTGELMFGNEPPKSPDALDRKPLARTTKQFRGTLPVIVIASRRVARMRAHGPITSNVKDEMSKTAVNPPI